MEFDLTEKYAIIRALERVAKADSKLREEEMNLLIRVTGFFDLDSDDIHNAKELEFTSVKNIITRMDSAKKEYLKRLLVELSNSDQQIDSTELKTILEIIL